MRLPNQRESERQISLDMESCGRWKNYIILDWGTAIWCNDWTELIQLNAKKDYDWYTHHCSAAFPVQQYWTVYQKNWPSFTYCLWTQRQQTHTLLQTRDGTCKYMVLKSKTYREFSQCNFLKASLPLNFHYQRLPLSTCYWYPWLIRQDISSCMPVRATQTEHGYWCTLSHQINTDFGAIQAYCMVISGGGLLTRNTFLDAKGTKATTDFSLQFKSLSYTLTKVWGYIPG